MSAEQPSKKLIENNLLVSNTAWRGLKEEYKVTRLLVSLLVRHAAFMFGLDNRLPPPPDHSLLLERCAAVPAGRGGYVT